MLFRSYSHGRFDRGIDWYTDLEELSELLTVLNSYDLTCDKLDRQDIGDQHHLYHPMTRVQITLKSWKPLLSSVDTSVIIAVLASSVSFYIRYVK